MAEVALTDKAWNAMLDKLLICHIPIAATHWASLYQDAADQGIVWVWLVNLETMFPIDVAVPLAELDQFVVALIGRYSPETILM